MHVTVGCSDLDYISISDVHTFSQAPGTKVLLSCNNDGDEYFINITCQANGHWLPDPICFLGKHVYISATHILDINVYCNFLHVDLVDDLQGQNVSQIPSEKQSTPLETFLIPVYVLAGVVALILCVIMGLTAACVWRGILKRKGRKREESHSTIGANNCVYDDIHCDPVYDTINPSNVSVCDLKFPLSSNEAYTSAQFKEANFNSLRGELTNRDAQATSGTGSTLTLLDNNCAYQTAATLCHTSTVATQYSEGFDKPRLHYCGKHHLSDPSVKNSQQLLQEWINNTHSSQICSVQQIELAQDFQNQLSVSNSIYSSNNKIEQTATCNDSTMDPICDSRSYNYRDQDIINSK